MTNVEKLIIVTVKKENRTVKYKFKTIYDDSTNEKKYFVAVDDGEYKECSKDLGNRLWKEVRQNCVVIGTNRIIDNSKVNYIKVDEHYEIFVNGMFRCSCDLNELESTLKEIKEGEC